MSLPSFMALCLFAHCVPQHYRQFSAASLVVLCVVFITTDLLAETKPWNDVRVPIARKFRVSNFKPEFLLNFDKKTFELTVNKYQKRFERCDEGDPVLLTYGKGGRGSFYGGWCRYQMGKYALSDALLARLPSAVPRIGRISHIPRSLPNGYAAALETGDLSGMNPRLQEYYKPLELIIRGDLFNPERLATILRFNLGYYDHFRREYIDEMDARCAAAACKKVATGWPDKDEELRLNQRHRKRDAGPDEEGMNAEPDNED